MSIRPDYYLHGGWTLEEYLHFWEGERKMEEAIKGGAFRTAIEKGLDAGVREARTNNAIKKACEKKSVVAVIRKGFAVVKEFLLLMLNRITNANYAGRRLHNFRKLLYRWASNH